MPFSYQNAHRDTTRMPQLVKFPMKKLTSILWYSVCEHLDFDDVFTLSTLSKSCAKSVSLGGTRLDGLELVVNNEVDNQINLTVAKNKKTSRFLFRKLPRDERKILGELTLLHLNGVDFKFRADIYPVPGYRDLRVSIYHCYSRCAYSGAEAVISFLMSLVSVPIRELSLCPHSPMTHWMLGFNSLRKVETLTVSGQNSSRSTVKEMLKRLGTKTLKKVFLIDAPMIPDHTEGIEFTEIQKIDELYVAEEGWITSKEFLELDCKKIQMNFPILSNSEMNQFLKRWKEGPEMRLEWVEWPTTRDFIFGEVVAGIDVQQWNKKKRDGCYRFYRHNETVAETWVNCEGGLDMERADGLLATLVWDRSRIRFFVWRERFPVTKFTANVASLMKKATLNK